MKKSELEIHFEEIRKMQNVVKQLYDKIASDKTDDAVRLRCHYDAVSRELRYMLACDYDAENL